MNKLKSFAKDFLWVCLIIFLIITLHITIFNELLFNNDSVRESNNTSVQLIGLIIGAITIYFLIKTYIAQKTQIDDNKKDSEYNRVIELVYRQLEFIDKRLNKPLEETSKSRYFTTSVVSPKLLEIKSEFLEKCILLNIQLGVISAYIESSSIKSEKKNKLFNLVYNNIISEHEDEITLTKTKIQQYLSVESCKKNNFNSYEYNLLKKLSYALVGILEFKCAMERLIVDSEDNKYE